MSSKAAVRADAVAENVQRPPELRPVSPQATEGRSEEGGTARVRELRGQRHRRILLAYAKAEA